MALRPDWLPALAAFESAARHQNFTHAAEELHLTASAVSHHVRKLEGRIGVPLFRRHARGVRLTAEGRRLADAAGSALADVDEALRSLRARPESVEQVRISTLHSFASGWLSPRLPAFAAAHPGVRLVFDTSTALARFDAGGPDLAIRHGPGQWPGLTALPLLEEALFPVAPPALAGRLRTPADIARQPLIADLGVQGWRDWFRAAGLRTALPEERYVFSDSTDMLEAAAQGMGVALARALVVVPWLQDGRLVRLPGPELAGRYAYHVVHPAQRRLSPPARSFVDWLVAQARG